MKPGQFFAPFIACLVVVGLTAFALAAAASENMPADPPPVRYCPVPGSTVAKPYFLPCSRVRQAEREA
jgi:hypothetical protein